MVLEERPDILLIEDSPSQVLQIFLQRAVYIDSSVLDGFQLLARLKRAAATAHIPVVMLTDRDHISSVERAIALGANDYLFKDDAAHQPGAVVGQLVGSTSPHNT